MNDPRAFVCQLTLSHGPKNKLLGSPDHQIPLTNDHFKNILIYCFGALVFTILSGVKLVVWIPELINLYFRMKASHNRYALLLPCSYKE